VELMFLGAAGTVTGSKYLVTAGDKKLLVDCGLFQGYKQLRLRNWGRFPIAPNRLDAVILSHAHLDHSGYLPLLIRNGFRGPVYCSHATRDLCGILLPDSGRLQEEEAEYANRHTFTKHHPALPLYTEDDALRALARLVPVEYGHEIRVGNVRATLHPAGHMLGAALVELAAGGASLLFSGDLGRPHDPLLRAPGAPPPATYLVIESTYGNRRHDARDPKQLLADVIHRTAARGGIVLVPSFAVGRAQLLLYLIEQLKRARTIPDVPVFLNSPMAASATRLYHKYPGEHRLTPAQCDAMCRAAQVVTTEAESRELNRRGGPMIVIAASGMATGGRVVHHLKAFAPDARNTVLFTGYQAGGTRGAAMLNGAEAVKIHGDYVPVRAEVVLLDGLSAHADYAEILAWLGHLKVPPRQTFITHGEPAAADALRLRIEERLGWACQVPEHMALVPLA